MKYQMSGICFQNDSGYVPSNDMLEGSDQAGGVSVDLLVAGLDNGEGGTNLYLF